VNLSIKNNVRVRAADRNSNTALLNRLYSLQSPNYNQQRA